MDNFESARNVAHIYLKNEKYKDQKRRGDFAYKELSSYVSKGSKFLTKPYNPKRLSKIRIVNRCIITYRARAVFKKFKMNRGCLRTALSVAQIPGYAKASW